MTEKAVITTIEDLQDIVNEHTAEIERLERRIQSLKEINVTYIEKINELKREK